MEAWVTTASRRLVTGREFTGDPKIDRIQRRIDDIANVLLAVPFLQGTLISVRLSVGVAKTISHRLGKPAAFFVARPNYDGTGFVANVVESSTADQAKIDQYNELSIVADLDCIVDLWFYPRASAAVPL
jgi:hypothetical protein